MHQKSNRKYIKQVSVVDGSRIIRIIDCLIDTDSKMRYALSKKIILETGLIDVLEYQKL